MNEDTKLTKHSVSSEFSMENPDMKEGRSSGRFGVSNSRDDVLELAPIETRASRGSKLVKESPRFSDTSISRSAGSSLQNENVNENENVGLKSSQDSSGEIEGGIRVEKEEPLQQEQQQQAAAVVVAAAAAGKEEEESNGNEMDEELAAKQKSQSNPVLREDEIGNAMEAEMEAENSQKAEKKVADESETNQKKINGVGTIDKKALLVIGDEIAAEESSKMNRVDDDKMVDEDKIQDEEKEKDNNIEKDRLKKEEKEKIKLDPEEVAQKTKNLAKLYNDINSEIQHIVNRDKSLFQKDPAFATNQNGGGESGKGEESMSTPSLSTLRNDARANAPSNADPVASNPNSNGLQRMNELENRANALRDSHAHNPMSFNQQEEEEESLEKSTRSSKRAPVYYEKSGYRRRPMQTESFQYSVNHVSLYPSFLEIGITSNFDGVSYCSVFDRKGRTLSLAFSRVVGHILLTSAINHHQSTMGGMGSIPLSPAIQHFGVFLQCEVTHPQRDNGTFFALFFVIFCREARDRTHRSAHVEQSQPIGDARLRVPSHYDHRRHRRDSLPACHHRDSMEAVSFSPFPSFAASQTSIPIAISPSPSISSPRAL